MRMLVTGSPYFRQADIYYENHVLNYRRILRRRYDDIARFSASCANLLVAAVGRFSG
jgi:hypothetical protein